jgi:riboflavin biosynthesis pyrimidine reductase
VGPAGARGPVTDADLRELYAAPQPSWVRANMISTLDGAATGDDGRSGSINNAVDKRVFDVLRDLADAVVVGAGTAEAERYGPAAKPIVVVSRTGRVPQRLLDAPPGHCLLATCQAATGVEEVRERLGADQVLVLGGHRVDLAQLRTRLEERGHRHLLAEGGPHLLRDLCDQGVLDELDMTLVPRLVGGLHPRVTDGPPVDVALDLELLLEAENTLLGRWSVRR